MKSSVFKSTGEKNRDFIIVNIIVHVFAITHALVCFILRSNGVDDGIFLTILTLLMIIILINFFNGTIDVFVSLSLLSLLAGFYIGTKGADVIAILIPENEVITHVLATFAVTEILGWMVFFILRKRLVRK